MAASKITAYQALRNKYPATECVLLEEVSNGTGASRDRSLDYMVINLWPSRGLSVIGIEKKSHRSDWLNELKTPQKQEAHFKHCDFFYLLTDNDNVAKPEEIPTTWGWMHLKGSSIKILKEAPKLSPEPIGRSFMCAMLRRAASKDGFIHKDEIEERILQEVKSRADYKSQNYDHIRNELDRLQNTVHEFEVASGVKIDQYTRSAGKIGKAVSVVLSNSTEEYHEKLTMLYRRVESIQSSIKNAINDLKHDHT